MRANQRGIVPIIVLVLFVIASGVGLIAYRNKPAPDPSASTEAQPPQTPTEKPSVFDNFKKTLEKATTPTPPSSANSPSPTNTPSPTNNSSPTPTPTPTSLGSSSSIPTSTPTPTPTVAPTPTPTPSGTYVQVTYPNGGENFTQGESITVTWSTNIFGSCHIQTIDSNNSGIVIGSSVWAANQSISWTVNMGNTTLNSKQFKIYMICKDFNKGDFFESSDNYFSINKE